MTAFSFSYAPKASSALASINPLKSGGEGLRFTANTPMSFLKQNPEVVTEGFWKGRQALTEGIVKGVTSALSGVTGALAQKAADAKADTKLKEDRAHEIAIANIKAAPTASETAYQQQRSDLLAQQIQAATAKNQTDAADDGFNAIPSGAIDWGSYNRKDFQTPVNEVPSVPATTPSSTTPPPASVPPPSAAPAAQPNVSQSIFGKSSNPAFVTLRDKIKQDKIAQGQVTPQESNIFSDISAITPPESQLDRPYTLPLAESSVTRQLPESEGNLALTGETLPLMRVEGAEDKPLAGTPSPVNPPLSTQQPSEPVLAQAVPETEAEYRYRVESDLTGQPFMNPADARMAKNILEQQLGVKAKVNGIDAGKGKRIYRVEIIEDAPSPMESVPKDMVMKQVVDKDGQLTNTYVPAVPIEQQAKSIEVGIDRAKTLKKAIADIKAIAGGISPGVGGAANLMSKLPFPTDASTVQSLNETIKGIIGFKELVDLKAAGGSLGALSDAELAMLTSLQGSLDVKNLHSGTYLNILKDIEKRANDVQTKLEAHQKNLMNVEKKTNFQPIQPKSQTNKKGDSFIYRGNRYVHDGTEFKLSN